LKLVNKGSQIAMIRSYRGGLKLQLNPGDEKHVGQYTESAYNHYLNATKYMRGIQVSKESADFESEEESLEPSSEEELEIVSEEVEQESTVEPVPAKDAPLESAASETSYELPGYDEMTRDNLIEKAREFGLEVIETDSYVRKADLYQAVEAYLEE